MQPNRGIGMHAPLRHINSQIPNDMLAKVKDELFTGLQSTIQDRRHLSCILNTPSLICVLVLDDAHEPRRGNDTTE